MTHRRGGPRHVGVAVTPELTGRLSGGLGMSKLKGLKRAFVACLAALPGVVLGHHARFGFDDSALVEVEGTVESVFWRNPHIRFMVRRVTDAGEDELWEMEGGPVNALERAGIDSAAIQVGARVTVLGLVSRLDEHSMLPVHLTRGGGAPIVLARDRAEAFGLLDAGAEPARVIGEEEIESAIREANGIFRVWTNIGRTQTRSSHPLTAAARAAKESWDQPSDDLALRCQPAGMPEAMVSPFPIEILEEGDNIIMRLEEWDNVRVVRMGEEGGIDPEPSSRLGYSIGEWEGRTLIVKTNRIDYPYLDDRGTPQSEAVEIEERFTLSADETRLDWTATVVDPNTLIEPTTLPNMHWEWVPGEKVKPYNCTLLDEIG